MTRAPVIIGLDSDHKAVVGQSASLFCNADGYPKPLIGEKKHKAMRLILFIEFLVWKRENDKPIQSKTNVHNEANLTIFQVKKEDRGNYICEVSNGIGETVSKTVLFDVYFAPIVIPKMPKTGQKEGYEAELICLIKASPTAKVSWWTRDEKKIKNDEHFEVFNISSEETISTLKIKKVTLDHFGNYTCRAKNAFGSSETTLELYGELLFKRQKIDLSHPNC